MGQVFTRQPGRQLARRHEWVDKRLSGRLPLDQINHGFDLLREGKALRQVVVFA